MRRCSRRCWSAASAGGGSGSWRPFKKVDKANRYAAATAAADADGRHYSALSPTTLNNCEGRLFSGIGHNAATAAGVGGREPSGRRRRRSISSSAYLQRVRREGRKEEGGRGRRRMRATASLRRLPNSAPLQRDGRRPLPAAARFPPPPPPPLAALSSAGKPR